MCDKIWQKLIRPLETSACAMALLEVVFWATYLSDCNPSWFLSFALHEACSYIFLNQFDLSAEARLLTIVVPLFFLVILKAPIIREIALWLRVVDVGLESCRYILTKMGPGNSVAISIGGAAELLDSCHKDYILTLKRRKKFVKMALETG